jgi:hypothetical protein
MLEPEACASEVYWTRILSRLYHHQPEMLGTMSTNWVLLIVAVAIIVGGLAYYEHRRNTVAEVDIGNHSLTIQKNP